VHVLNGFFNSVIEGQRGVDLATKLTVQKFSADEIRQTADDMGIPVPGDASEMRSLRTSVKSVLASDGKVFPSLGSFQIAHPAFVSRDRTGAGYGSLAATLLLEEDGGEQALRELVDAISAPQANPVWVMEAALADRIDSDGYSIGDPGTRPLWCDEPEFARLKSDLGELVKRAVLFAARSPDPLEGLRVLAVTATWVSCLAFAQVSALKASGQSAVLLLTVAPPIEVPTVVESSHLASYQAVVSNFRDWTTQLMCVSLRDRLGLRDDDQGSAVEGELRELVSSAKPFTDSKALDKTVQQAGKLFDDYQSGGECDGPIDAAASTLVDLLDASMNVSPGDWLAHMGRCCGFVAPRRGPKDRRFCVEPALVPALVLAGMDLDDEWVPLEDWSARLESRFGLVFGPGNSIRGVEPTPVEPELVRNRDALVELLENTGLATAYSDLVSEVVNPMRRDNDNVG
jgi:hypothetical protein